MAIRVSKNARTHVSPVLRQTKQKVTPAKRVASKRNTNAKSKRVATKIK